MHLRLEEGRAEKGVGELHGLPRVGGEERVPGGAGAEGAAPGDALTGEGPGIFDSYTMALMQSPLLPLGPDAPPRGPNVIDPTIIVPTFDSFQRWKRSRIRSFDPTR